MSFDKISPVELPYSLELKKIKITFDKVPDAATTDILKEWIKTKFTWEFLLDQAAGSIGSAVGAALIKQLVGPSSFEQGVISNLNLIISKLDQILDAIRSLQEFIRQDTRQQWKNTLNAKIAEQMNQARAYLVGADNTGHLTEETLTAFGNAIQKLMDNIGEVVNYQEPKFGRAITIPMHAAIQAGVMMVLAGHRLLKLSKATSREWVRLSIEPAFQEWMQRCDKLADELYAPIPEQIAYVNGFPKKGAYFGGANGDPYYIPNMKPPRASICTVEISGSVDQPFQFVGSAVIPFDTREDADKNWSNYPLFPLPYMFISPFLIEPPSGTPWLVGGLSIAEEFAKRAISDLNAKRTKIASDLEEYKNLAALSLSLRNGLERFKKLTE